MAPRQVFLLCCCLSVLVATAVMVMAQVPCPDGSQCDSGNTCCQLQDGSYGCCPYPNADCCSDKAHCCPANYTCNLKAGTCDKKKGDWLTSVPMQTLKESTTVTDVDCQDGSSCPDGNTCCQLQDGSYGCCPYPNADCCSDKAHCCPNSYVCDMKKGTCDKGKNDEEVISIPIGVKTPSRKPTAVVAVEDVDCQDGSSCPDGNTCCQLQDGSYGCCPYPNADCCSDKAHCCPSGYTCDLKAMTCNKGKLDHGHFRMSTEMKEIKDL